MQSSGEHGVIIMSLGTMIAELPSDLHGWVPQCLEDFVESSGELGLDLAVGIAAAFLNYLRKSSRDIKATDQLAVLVTTLCS